MSDPLNVEYPNPFSLSIKKTKAGGLRDLLASLGIGLWYVVVPVAFFRLVTGELPPGLTTLEGWSALARWLTDGGLLGWMFLVAPLFVVPQLFKSLKVSLFGDVFVVDGIARTISRNGRQRALFSDCRAVEIRTLGGEGPADHWVSVVLRSGSSLFVADSSDYEQMATLAADLARVLKTGIVKA